MSGERVSPITLALIKRDEYLKKIETQIDSNQDGETDESEMAKMDTDGDGTVSKEEFAAYVDLDPQIEKFFYLRDGWHVVLDLSGANLSGVDLRGLNLRGWGLMADSADFSGANLEGRDLSRSTFKGANFQKANLLGIWAEGVDFSGADLSGANLMKANFTNLRDGFESHEHINIFTEANLRGANVEGARFHKANFTGVDLTLVLGSADYRDVIFLP